MRFLTLLLVGTVLISTSAETLADVVATAEASVLQVRVHHPNGRSAFGSAVVIGPGKLITNAHVTHGATRIEVTDGDHRRAATVVAHDSVRDLCLLDAPGIAGQAPQWSRSLKAGQRIYAAGFSADQGFTVTTGNVIALHDYDRAEVIQLSAPFDYGSSGGGLFDEQGRLVGLLTFKARAGGLFHFAVPIAWIEQGVDGKTARHASSDVPFWQRPAHALPYFLRAASLEATRDWARLAALALQWARNEPENRGSWSALAKARSQMERALHAAASPEPGSRSPTGTAGLTR
jgi:hypothetical protein